MLSLVTNRIGDEERRLMHLVPAPAVRLMKRPMIRGSDLSRISPTSSGLLFMKPKVMLMIAVS